MTETQSRHLTFLDSLSGEARSAKTDGFWLLVSVNAREPQGYQSSHPQWPVTAALGKYTMGKENRK